MLLASTATCAERYRGLPTRFTLSQLVVSVALPPYALSSDPLVRVGFGCRTAGVGPFTLLPDPFAVVAVAVRSHRSAGRRGGTGAVAAGRRGRRSLSPAPQPGAGSPLN